MMTIEEFIKHLKHKSLRIKIIEEQDKNLSVIFLGDVGVYLNWVERKTYGKMIIHHIIPSSNGFTIIYEL